MSINIHTCVYLINSYKPFYKSYVANLQQRKRLIESKPLKIYSVDNIARLISAAHSNTIQVLGYAVICYF